MHNRSQGEDTSEIEDLGKHRRTRGGSRVALERMQFWFYAQFDAAVAEADEVGQREGLRGWA
jgi:hypothetical protein